MNGNLDLRRVVVPFFKLELEAMVSGTAMQNIGVGSWTTAFLRFLQLKYAFTTR